MKDCAEQAGDLFDGRFHGDRAFDRVRVKIIGLVRLATLFAIAIEFREQRHQCAGQVPIVFTFGFRHQHELP